MKDQNRMRFENFFLTWGNNLIREDLNNITGIHNELEGQLPEQKPASRGLIYERVRMFIEARDPGLIDRIRKDEEYNSKNWIVVSLIESAFEAVYGWRDGFCENKCWRRQERSLLFGDCAFTGENRISCIECEQLAFRCALQSMEETRQIDDTTRYGLQEGRELASAFFTENGDVKILKPGNPFKLSVPGKFLDNYFKFVVQDHLAKLAYYSLGLFLQKNGIEKLASCDWCHHFFIKGKSPIQKFCSASCRLKNHNQEDFTSGRVRKIHLRKRSEGDERYF